MPGPLSATELIAGYRARDLSPVEAVQACLETIARRDPELHAFCLVDGEGALAAARASEARWRQGAPAGALDGVPVAVKDAILCAGWPTGRGFSPAAAAPPAAADGPPVAALRRHGAVPIGKTALPQIGWKGVTDAPGRPATRNPWAAGRTAGGSSGGSAAALAAGMVPLALGTDGGGSVRIPAGFCGVVGLKATFARVAQWPPSPFGLISHTGPMARTVADVALMLDVLSEPDGRDWTSLPAPAGAFAAGLEDGVAGLRIAFSPALGGEVAVDPEVAAAVARAAGTLAGLGAAVGPADPPLAGARAVFDVLWECGAAAGVASLSDAQRAELEPGLAELAARGARRSALEWLAADKARGELGVAMAAFHRDWDLLATPTLPLPAFAAGQVVPDGSEDPDWQGWTPFTYPFNLTQQPAITVPCGRTADGLPIGLQLVGARHAEALVLRAARAYERAASVSPPAPSAG